MKLPNPIMAKLANSITVGCWLALFAYWFFSALTAKAVAERKSFRSSLAYRVPFLFGAILIWDPRLFHKLNVLIIPHTVVSQALGALGCVAGLFVAIWARWTLAGNWSSNVTFKQGHELIKTGPYRFARHPIYTGILLMILATTVQLGWLRCWIGLAFMFVALWIKLKQEETLLLQHFPDTYPAYQKEVKALVPFVI
jgi:protein-S-isoprenylcysteine O-methyltransferase Ste14